MTDIRQAAAALVDVFEKKWPGVLRVGSMNKGEGCHGSLINLIESALQAQRAEECAAIAKYMRREPNRLLHDLDAIDWLDARAKEWQR